MKVLESINNIQEKINKVCIPLYHTDLYSSNSGKCFNEAFTTSWINEKMNLVLPFLSSSISEFLDFHFLKNRNEEKYFEKENQVIADIIIMLTNKIRKKSIESESLNNIIVKLTNNSNSKFISSTIDPIDNFYDLKQTSENLISDIFKRNKFLSGNPIVNCKSYSNMFISQGIFDEDARNLSISYINKLVNCKEQFSNSRVAPLHFVSNMNTLDQFKNKSRLLYLSNSTSIIKLFQQMESNFNSFFQNNNKNLIAIIRKLCEI